MAIGEFGLFAPSAWVPASDPLLVQKVNEIANAAQENGRLEAVYLGVIVVARAVFINIPYHVVMGTFNAIQIFSDEPVLEHLVDLFNNLIFTALAITYIAAGILYLPAFEAFRIRQVEAVVEEEKKPSKIDHSPSVEALNEVLSQLEAQVKERSEEDQEEEASPLVELIHTLPLEQQELLRAHPEELMRSLILEDSVPPVKSDPLTVVVPEDLMRSMFLEDSIPPAIFDLSKVVIQEDYFPLNEPKDPSTVVIPDEEDFIHVEGPVLPEVDVHLQELYGVNGIQMRRMGYRAALDEYARLLQEEFGIVIDTQLEEMRSWTETEQVRLLRNTLLMLRYPEIAGGTYHEAAGQYKAFVAEHRKLIAALEVSPGDQEVVRIAQALATVRFRANMQTYSEDLVKLHTLPHRGLTAKNFHRHFVQRNQEINQVPASMKMSYQETSWRQLYGALSWLDFFMEPDVPNVRGTSHWVGPQGEKRSILHLRHATPHIAGAAIAPEYRAFVRAKAAQKEGVLYTAYQRLNDPGRGENEDARCQSLIQLERENPNFYLLFHSVENTLFKKPKTTFAELREALIDSFYHPDAPNGNRLPLLLQNKPEYRRVMEELFDQVHTLFFNGKTDVDPTPIDHFGTLEEGQKICEWQECIMLFYYFQREDIKFRFDLPVTTEVNPCKDNFDRGGGQNITMDRARQHKIHGSDVPEESLESTLASVQAPPIMGKGLPAIDKRINPSLAVSHRLANLPREKMEAFQKLRFQGWQLTDYTVQKREGQHAVPLPQDARTPQELVECIHAIPGRHTISKDSMVQENGKRYPSKEAVLKQLDSILGGRAYIAIDGIHYNGQQPYWYNASRYDAQGILELLMHTHQLSEEKALHVMRQLEVQIFADPLEALKKAFDRPDLNLYVEQLPQPPHEVRICLNTVGDAFVITGAKKFQLRDIEQEGALLTTFDTTVTLRIPKDDAQRESGEWSWGHA